MRRDRARQKDRPIVVGLGEVLWDVFPEGPRFGGAPANFACSAAGLAPGKVQAWMVSAVGRDELGRRALEELAEHGVDASLVSLRDEDTGRVLVRLDDAGHASYEFAQNTAWDNLEWSNELGQLASRADAVCFGTLGQRSNPSRRVVRKFLEATPVDCLRVLDVNLRPPHWTPDVLLESLPLASVLKCNDAELPLLASLLQLGGSELELLRALLDRTSLTLAALTRGASGSLLVHKSGEVSELPGKPAHIVDTVGAGDAFTAALVLGLLEGLPLAVINDWASRVAAYVCSQAGATPSLPAQLHQDQILRR